MYGWGWVNANGETRDTPEPFRVACDHPDALHGIVLGDHEFSGAILNSSPRHAPTDGNFKVEIRRDARPVAHGYAEA
jgi:hypothetical protein